MGWPCRAVGTGRGSAVTCALLAALLVPAAAEGASGDRIRAQLQVQAGATCLSAGQLAAQVELWLQGAPVDRGLAIRVTGAVQDPRSARLQVLHDGRTLAHRAFEPGPARCSHFHAALGLAIALAIKASIVEDLGRPLAEDPAKRATGWSLSAGALWTHRTLLRPAAGAALLLRRGLSKHVAVRLGLVGVFASNVPLEQPPGNFDAVLVLARLEACARSSWLGPLRAALCIGVAGGGLHASGAEIDNPRRSLVGWSALTNALELELELTSELSLVAGASASHLLHRVKVGVVDPQDQPVASRTLDRTAFSLSLGPLYHF